MLHRVHLTYPTWAGEDLRLVRLWRFHRGYQVAAYRLQIALCRAEMNPKAASVHREFVSGINRILDAGKELDESDGRKDAKSPSDKPSYSDQLPDNASAG